MSGLYAFFFFNNRSFTLLFDEAHSFFKEFLKALPSSVDKRQVFISACCANLSYLLYSLSKLILIDESNVSKEKVSSTIALIEKLLKEKLSEQEVIPTSIYYYPYASQWIHQTIHVSIINFLLIFCVYKDSVIPS